MEPRGQQGIVIGYDNDNTAYRIVQLSDSKIAVIHHATLNKNVFVSLPSTIEKTFPFSLDFNIMTPTSNNDTEMEITGTCKPTMTRQEIEENRHEELPDKHSAIKVIGPWHPTLINSAVDNIYILPYNRWTNVLLTTINKAPDTYIKAIKSKDKSIWQQAIKSKLTNTATLKVWDVVDLQENTKLLVQHGYSR
ncbi:hypothetical protein O181_031178 [Austropuccinia psidii MF-1]|uniref:Uncharacterized protein n=1 Tax=Austropuccinia psidii MF-1 TaxID=1389203 RepID=A0A9Q3CWY4_9BASI|nr:hypothetical protein [Austropuccinia psidii MF-1]